MQSKDCKNWSFLIWLGICSPSWWYIGMHRVWAVDSEPIQEYQSRQFRVETHQSTELPRLYSHISPNPIPLLVGQKPSDAESDSNQELNLRVRPKKLEIPVTGFKPIGYLNADVGYFQSSNIFSVYDRPIKDGVIFSGLTLASAYFPLGRKTFLNSSINGYLIRYLDQSQYNYNQLKFNLGIYQQLSSRMYGEFAFSNQQFFHAHQGDSLLNESSILLSLGRRDSLTPKLGLNSLYQLSVNFSDPQNRSRVINSVGISLDYVLQKPLQIGLDYQLRLSDFTQRDREDQLHRLFAHLNYQINNSSNLNVQSGISLGNSTIPNIDYSGWFFSVNYHFELGRF